ncbi:hypothetical protein EDD16DRAFT_1718086 [Pisolithus croceorrhizus]|nr:hypothetical protein EV401DRAFT_2082242 [Pisolithus croceorrhizus]KAI6099298.1 hypothetical protein EDD16DRAFT_1718086 [Pisolithus croceorrhizus]
MSLSLTPPPSSPQSHDMSNTGHRSVRPPPVSPSPLRNSKAGLDDNADLGISRHFLEHDSSRIRIACNHGNSIPGDNSGDYLSSLPPTIRNLSASVNRTRTKFAPYHLRREPSSIEVRFTEKSLRRRANHNVTLEDVKVGKSTFICGLRGMPKDAFHRALAMKEADREAARLHALTTAWELEAVNRRRDFLLAAQAEDVQRFIRSADDLWLFMTVLEHCSVDELKDEEDFHLAAYGQDLTQLTLEDEHLSQMEECAEGKAVDSQDNLMVMLATLVNADSVGTDESDEDEHGD